MNSIPREGGVQSAVGLLREGFPYIQNRCRRFQSDLFEIAVPFAQVVCMSGREASELFYDTTRFERKGAIPKRVQKTLLGENPLHTLDNGAHRHRKELLLSVMSPESIGKLMNLMNVQWHAYQQKWEKRERIVLFEEVQEILCRAACAWAGLPLWEPEVRQRSREFAARVDAFGAMGPRYWRGKQARRSTEKWVMGIIEKIRSGKLRAAEGTPAHLMAFSPDFTGRPFDLHMAAVELINLVRPTVAVSWYIVFAALALHEHPEYREKLRAGNDELTELFVHEVRRFYPFAPFVGAKVRVPFDWRGYHFRKGALVLLDVYGTNRDGRQWEHPEDFWPERFRQWDKSPYNFIPQGGGDHHRGHRCPGEWITIEATKLAVNFLTQRMTYQVPAQDLRFPLSRLPTFPRSGFIITQVKGSS